MHQTSVRPVHVPTEPDSSYFLRVDWSERGLGSGFELLLTDGQNAWRGDGKNVNQIDLLTSLTFNVLDTADLWSPDDLTCLTTHRHFSPGNILKQDSEEELLCSFTVFLLSLLKIRMFFSSHDRLQADLILTGIFIILKVK